MSHRIIQFSLNSSSPSAHPPLLLAKSQYETRELIISRFDSAKYWYDYALRILEEFENPVGILYQQNLIARDVENYGVRQSMWMELTLSYNDITMAQLRDGSRFVKSSEVSESTQK